MYIFTPNTLIESSKVNANFAEVTNLENVPRAYGYIAGATAIGTKTLTLTTTTGLSMQDTNTTVRADVAGTYFVDARQLIQNGGNALYWSIRKNGSDVSYAYMNATAFYDAQTSWMGPLAVGDKISINYSTAVTNSWGGGGGAHSIFSMFRVGA